MRNYNINFISKKITRVYDRAMIVSRFAVLFILMKIKIYVH